ncbi:MAG: dihydroorotate dehydrogenase electron transfer subunit [Desulfovibrio sp.]|jgi:dihydroorotate dehydrogenase electron transfer subunit|nr:dihydroorotate dehydrogenase electron transfer subunit [Desulfovibrio sp.]
MNPIISRLKILDIVPFGRGPKHGFFALRLTPPKWESCAPGQFVMLHPRPAHSEAICPRPFSICKLTDGHLIVFFQVRGRVTAEMAALQAGDTVQVTGPLGNSLPARADRPTLILAGGIGIAPFVEYVDKHPRPATLSVEFAHRHPLECYPFEDIAEKCASRSHLETCEQDRAAFVALMEQRIREFPAAGLILACGPMPFLRLVRDMAAACKAEAHLCLETRMACGIGACLGCVVKAHLPATGNATPVQWSGPAAPPDSGAFVRTCACGPNFRADQVFF